MDALLFFLLIACLVVAALAFMIFGHYQEKQRTEQMQTVADRMGFSFRPEDERSLGSRLRHFHLFSQGRSRKIRNVMRSEIDGIAATLFDYEYKTGSGKQNHTHRRTVVLLETERLRLPFFTLRPEGLFHRLAGSLGYQDIDFEAHPDFSDSYLLRGPDESEIRERFGEEVLCYYERHAGLCTEGDGQQLLFYQGKRREDAARIEDFFEQGLVVLDLFVKKVTEEIALPADRNLEQANMLDAELAKLQLEGWE
jgi:hypothetical protein